MERTTIQHKYNRRQTALLRLTLLLLMMVGAKGAWGQTVVTTPTYYYQDDVGGSWISENTDRYTVSQSGGNTYISAVGNGNNGTKVYTRSTKVVPAGVCYILSFDIKLKGGTDQASWFQVNDADDIDVNISNEGSATSCLTSSILILAQEGAGSNVWTINNNGSQEVTLSTTSWYNFRLIRTINKTYLSITDNSDNSNKFFGEITTLSTTGGLGGMELATKRYYTELSIDNLKVIKLGWDVNSFSVNLATTNDDNKPTEALPILYKPDTDFSSNDVTYSYNDPITVIRNQWDTPNYPPRLLATGTGTVTASFHVVNSIYTMNVTSPTGAGTYDAATNTYSFTSIGTLSSRTISDVQGLTMSFGGGRTAVVVERNNMKVLKLIDANGYSNPWLTSSTGVIPPESEWSGTFYKFQPSINGTLTFVGQFDTHPRIYESNGTEVSGNITTVDADTRSIDLVSGKTYYLYNTHLSGSDIVASSIPMLHSFRYGGFTVNYTVKFVDEENNTLKASETRSGLGGASITLTDADRATFEYGGNRYVYDNNDIGSRTIAFDGSTVVTVVYHKAGTCNYELKSNVGNFSVKGSGLEGDVVSIAYPRYVVDNDKKLYIYSSIGYQHNYHHNMTLAGSTMNETLNYNAADAGRVCYFSEAEDIEGLTSSTVFPNDVGASMGLGGWGNVTGMKITSLKPGTYKIIAAVNGYEGATYTFNLGSLTLSTNGSLNEGNTTFSINEETDLTLTTTNTEASKTLDYVMVLKLFGYEQNEATAYLEDLQFTNTLTNETGQIPTISFSEPGYVAEQDKSTVRLIKTTGSDPDDITEGTPLTVTASSYANVSYQLRVKTRNELHISGMISDEYFRVGTTVGRLMEESATVNGVTLYFGANTTDDGKDEQQVVREVYRDKYGITGIDISGYTWGALNSNGYNWGTFYKIVVPSGGRHITFTGYFSKEGSGDDANATLTRNDYTTLETITNTGEALATAEFALAEGTYYLYAPYPTAFCLNSMRVEYPRQDITFSNTEVYKVMDDIANVEDLTYAGPTATNNSPGGGIVTYTSSNPAAATVNATTGAITLVGSGITTITATAAAVDNTYSETTKTGYVLNVNIKENWNSVGHSQKWLFEESLGGQWTTDSYTIGSDDKDVDYVPESRGLKFNNTNNRINFSKNHYIHIGASCDAYIPNLQKGQVVELSLFSSSSTINVGVQNGLDFSNRRENPIFSIGTGGGTYRFIVKEDGAFYIKGQNYNGCCIRAIYVYTPITTTGDITYDGNNEMRVGATILPTISNYKDKWNRSRQNNQYDTAYGITSANSSALTINNTSTGDATGNATGTGISVTGYAKSLDPLNYKDAALSASVTVKTYVAAAAHTIEVSDLLYLPMKTSADNGLDRVIPRFTLTLTGGTKLMSNGDGSGLTFNGGTMIISSRLAGSHTQDVLISRVVLFYDDGTSESISQTPANSISITKREHVVKRIVIEYQSSDADLSDNSGTAPDTQFDLTKIAPDLSFSPNTYTIEDGMTMNTPAATTSPKNLSGVRYSISNGGHVTLSADEKTITSVSAGNETLTASFTETTYFANAAANAAATITVATGSHVATLDITNKLKVDRTPMIDGFAFAGEKVIPAVAVTNKSTGVTLNVGTDYTVTYSTSDPSLAYIDQNGYIITQRNAEGLVTIIADVKLSSGTLLTQQFKLQVLSGEWDFRKFIYSLGNSMQGNGGWFKDNNGHSYSRDRDAYEYMLQDNGEPLSMGMALQSWGHVRWYANSEDATAGHFYHFGHGTGEGGRGGVLKVPVRKGMVIEIYAWSDGNDHADMIINTTGNRGDEDNAYAAVSDFEGNPVVGFQINSYAEAHRFLVTDTDNDGFLYIVDPSSGLPLQMSWIKLSNDIIFKYGYETYAPMVPSSNPSDATFINPMINEQENEVYTYEYENVNATTIATDIDTDGNVGYAKDLYGTYKVYVTRQSDDHTRSYTVHVVQLNMSDDSQINTNEITLNAAYLRSRISSINYNSSDGLSVEAMKDLISYSIKSYTTPYANIEGTTGSQMLTVVGVGNVVLTATLGAINVDFTITFSGASLKEEAPVVPLTAKEYTFEVEGSPSSISVALASEGILGDLRAVKDLITYTLEDNYIKIKRSDNNAFGYGGTIPVNITYVYNEVPHTITPVLTVAYVSHSWRFDHNMLFFNNDIYKGIADFYTNKHSVPPTRTGSWTANASFSEPIENGTEHADDDWQFIRKMGNHPESDVIFNYRHNVFGTNVLIIPETSGLIINANCYNNKNNGQFGVQMMSTRRTINGVTIGDPNIVSIDTNFDGINDATGYDIQNVMLRSGGELVVPKVKPAQWIELRWYRHVEDKGERLQMTNLCDVNGTLIDKTYKIGNTQYGTYFFQVDPSLNASSPGAYIGIDGETYFDATFHISDNVYISIQEVILHEPGWNYLSSYNSSLALNNGTVANNQYVCDGTEQSFTLSGTNKDLNAPTAPRDWQVEVIGDLDYEIVGTTAKDYYDELKPGYYDDGLTFKFTNGWGKAYFTANSYTTNERYVANRRTWVVTFGKEPEQTYPHTWDFTKYFSTTKGNIGGVDDNVYTEDSHYNMVSNPTGAHEYRQVIDTWQQGTGDDSNKESALITGYDGSKYNSLFVDGAQLVSYALKDDATYQGILPETAGLGFSITDKTTGGLSLDMQNAVASAGAGANSSGETWRSGELTITGGGTIIVPKPGDGYSNFYIYVKSSVEPYSVTNANKMIASGTPAAGEEVDANYDVGTGQYKYHFTANDDAVIKFDQTVTVYAIGVTDIIKPLTTVGTGTKEGWATESRNRTIDYTVTGYLTTNSPQAYVVEDATHASSTREQNHRTTVKMGNEQKRYVVPHTPTAPIGLVMRQTSGVTADYNVPLFVPAVTTASDKLSTFSDNLMMANLHERLLTSERENGIVDTNGDNVDDSGNDNGAYTRFILAKRYMEWKKENNAVVNPTGFESQEAAVFYRLHLYGGTTQVGSSYKLKDENGNDIIETSADELNTLGANKAYLLLPTSSLPDPLWNANSPSRPYIAILGVSDYPDYSVVPESSSATYNLKGQAVNDNGTLRPGLYIRNGRKIIVK